VKTGNVFSLDISTSKAPGKVKEGETCRTDRTASLAGHLALSGDVFSLNDPNFY